MPGSVFFEAAIPVGGSREGFGSHIAPPTRRLPEDERERLLIDTAMAGLWHLVDMGDTKVLLFLAYEADRGRVPENRLSRLAPPLKNRGGLLSFGKPVADDGEAETVETAMPDAPVAGPSIKAPARTASTETLSDPAAFGRDTPERDAWIRRYFESRPALPGEGRAGTEEQ
jgi:hypothetical protein